MEIFEFKYKDGEIIEWVYANNKQEAIECCCNESGNTEHYVTANYVIGILDRDKWSDYKLIDPNEMEPDPDGEDYNEEDYSGGYKIIETFKEFVSGETKAFYITSNVNDF